MTAPFVMHGTRQAAYHRFQLESTECPLFIGIPRDQTLHWNAL
ncbi:hypothetical protein [Roseateles depolymerans]|nr:hypothetical protein [Roseateles depolymerans]